LVQLEFPLYFDKDSDYFERVMGHVCLPFEVLFYYYNYFEAALLIKGNFNFKYSPRLVGFPEVITPGYPGSSPLH
jgi:hypothetical protein